jgi:hypothetical protein
MHEPRVTLDQATNLEQLSACYDEEGNTLVYRLAYLTALLTQEADLLSRLLHLKKITSQALEKYTEKWIELPIRVAIIKLIS